MIIKKIFKVSLDMKAPTAQRNEWEVVEGDNGNIIEITLTDDGEPVDLSGCKVLAVFGLPTGQTVEQDTDEGSVTIGGDDSNIITIALRTGSFSPGRSSSGLMKCEIQVYSGELQDVLVTSAQFTFRCRRAIMNDETIAADDNYPVLVELIQEVQQLITREQSDWNEEDIDDPSYIRNKPGLATEDTPGFVQLYNGVDSESTTKAATPSAVKAAYDRATEALNALPCYPNLLDNWYFLDPINQRGETTYTANGYTVDRWVASSLASVKVESDGLKITTIGGTGGNLIQRFEKGRFTEGQKLTASVLLSDGTLHYGTAVLEGATTWFLMETGLYVSMGMGSPSYDAFNIQFVSSQSTTKTIVAVKLEAGGNQTLAYQDGNVWKLLEIPDRYDQLMRCERWFYRINRSVSGTHTIAIGHAWATNKMVCIIPMPMMRSISSVSLSGTFKAINNNGTSVNVSGIDAVKNHEGEYMCTLDVTTATTGLTKGSMYLLVLEEAGHLDFAADL